MPRPVASNLTSTIINQEAPIIKVPNKQDIIVRSLGWDFIVNDDGISVKDRKNTKTVFKINSDEIIIGNEYGEHIKLNLK